MNVRPLEQLTYADFQKAVKTPFRVWMDGQTSLELQLAEVTTSRMTAPGGAKNSTYENFTLVFQGPAGQVLPQRIYRFESAALGCFELFIVPSGQDAGGTQYQATFNRVLKSN